MGQVKQTKKKSEASIIDPDKSISKVKIIDINRQLKDEVVLWFVSVIYDF